jgi:hypothetical protein
LPLPRVTPPQTQALLEALEDGRADYDEVERLLGFLATRGVFSSERTARRRRARLAELEVPTPDPVDLYAMEVAALYEAGEITAEQAERRLGRFALDRVRASHPQPA